MGTTLMTGGTRGLGRHAAAHLLRTRPDDHLVLLVRGDGDIARQLTRETGNPNVTTVRCDLASLADIRRAAAEVRERLATRPPLTGFLANAGLQMTSTEATTADGFELTFGVNVLANHLLLNLLLDLFANPARIIVVGSGVHFGDGKNGLGVVPPPRWDGVTALAAPRPGGVRAGREAYATSKLGVVYLVHALKRRLPAGIDVYSYAPGFVPGTGLIRDAGVLSRAAVATVGQLLRATPIGAGPAKAGRTLARTLTGPRPGDSGEYVDRGVAMRSSEESYDRAREEELWAVADELCGLAATRRTA
ncbi:SDR family NAD(P)-dependent oxidoreductase [Actinosynnema sp. NPDC047251]|uniref:Short-chain dehydrogenase/reductase n=1 Tax=Saccharothrix espanaensis (strain ATCC 51144 / DSM 44229 / JCM 9112 / NBRC 15066 / NRRL 15764) TaxID=1179773 RepID=K0K2D1_SACES|nr:SDR family NAD(P)-dependent oxidoreductase [Saccharothrix espanaensis]CCH30703.1 Short-chain dehydrogenase/reductase [Saccharothrix espanaensis DSM 44229]